MGSRVPTGSSRMVGFGDNTCTIGPMARAQATVPMPTSPPIPRLTARAVTSIRCAIGVGVVNTTKASSAASPVHNDVRLVAESRLLAKRYPQQQKACPRRGQ